MSYRITPEDVKCAERAGACREALYWLRTGDRTIAELIAEDKGWARWASVNVRMPDAAADELYAAGCGRAWRDEEGQYHRDDGPAREEFDGTLYYYRHGVFLGYRTVSGIYSGPYPNEIPGIMEARK